MPKGARELMRCSTSPVIKDSSLGHGLKNHRGLRARPIPLRKPVLLPRSSGRCEDYYQALGMLAGTTTRLGFFTQLETAITFIFLLSKLYAQCGARSHNPEMVSHRLHLLSQPGVPWGLSLMHDLQCSHGRPQEPNRKKDGS